jgi:myosin heavy subunit
MKKILTLVLLTSTILGAAEEAPRPDSLRGPRPPRSGETPLEEIQSIRKILELPPDRLSRLRGFIQQVEKLSPEDRQDIAQRLEALEKASPQERREGLKEIRERLKRASFGARILEYHWKKLSPEEAKQEREAFDKMSPEEKKAMIRELAEKYKPELEALRKNHREQENRDSEAPRPKPTREEIPEPLSPPPPEA